MAEIENILVRSEKGFITWSDVQCAIESYALMLPDPEMIKQKSVTFDGLIRYLHKTLIKPLEPKTDRINYKLCDDIFENIYLPLCALYGHQVNLLSFTQLCGIHYTNISNRYNQTINNNTDDNTLEINNIINKWKQTQESHLYGAVSDSNSVGSLFLLKSVFGYQETSFLKLCVDDSIPVLDTKQLDSLTASDDVLPLPDPGPLPE